MVIECKSGRLGYRDGTRHRYTLLVLSFLQTGWSLQLDPTIRWVTTDWRGLQ